MYFENFLVFKFCLQTGAEVDCVTAHWQNCQLSQERQQQH